MKGKEAAAAARRKTEELRALLDAAEEAHARRLDACSVEIQALKKEIASLSGVADRDIRRMADTRVAEAEDRITSQWHAERDRQQARLEDALKYIAASEHFTFQRGALARLATIAGVPVSLLFDALPNKTRRVRRAAAAELNFLDSYGPGHIPVLPRGGIVDDDGCLVES